jgi:hypothetical protein
LPGSRTAYDAASGGIRLAYHPGDAGRSGRPSRPRACRGHIVGLSRLIEPPGVWFVAVFLLGAVILGSLQVLHDETVDAADHALGIPIESLILPAVRRGWPVSVPSGSFRSGWRSCPR